MKKWSLFIVSYKENEAQGGDGRKVQQTDMYKTEQNWTTALEGRGEKER